MTFFSTSAPHLADDVEDVSLLPRRRGLDHESGLQGEFREIVHGLEEQFKAVDDKQAEVLLLQIRRSEKDYLLRGSEKYIR